MQDENQDYIYSDVHYAKMSGRTVDAARFFRLFFAYHKRRAGKKYLEDFVEGQKSSLEIPKMNEVVGLYVKLWGDCKGNYEDFTKKILDVFNVNIEKYEVIFSLVSKRIEQESSIFKDLPDYVRELSPDFKYLERGYGGRSKIGSTQQVNEMIDSLADFVVRFRQFKSIIEKVVIPVIDEAKKNIGDLEDQIKKYKDQERHLTKELNDIRQTISEKEKENKKINSDYSLALERISNVNEKFKPGKLRTTGAFKVKQEIESILEEKNKVQDI